MNCRVGVFASLCLLVDAGHLVAQASSQFGTCAYWQDQRPDAAKPATVDTRTTYRLGFAHGFVLGILGDLPTERASDSRWALLESRYDEGLVEALQRPAFLVEAFDQKCGDYRNRRVRLSDIGLLVLLEVGGMPAQQIEQALEIMRSRGDDYMTRAMDILSGTRSQ